MTETVSAELLDGVRERLARDAAPLTPAAGRPGVCANRAGRWVTRPCSPCTTPCTATSSAPGPLEPLLRLDGVTDVLVNGADQVWIDRGAGLERTGIGFSDDQAVRRLAQRLAAAGGRRLDDASPYVDLRLPDGSRFHAVLAPRRAAGHGALAAGPATAGVHAGRAGGGRRRGGRGRGAARAASCSAGWRSWSAAAPGSGKTTLLNALLSLVGDRRAAGPRGGRLGAAPRPRARGRARGATREHRGRRRGHRCARWCGRRCGCDRTGWSSARCAAPRWSTCSRR